MPKRTLATLLWAVVGWNLGAMLSFFVGLPAGLDLALTVALGAAVFFDPTGKVWGNGVSVASRRRARARLATLATE
jgi:hypothetical protein